MLDYFAIFTKGGALLWTLQFTALKHSPVEALNALIRTCLLEERAGETSYTYAPKLGAAQTLVWTYNNSLGLVFVAVYQKTLSLFYVDELLNRVKSEFSARYKQGGKSFDGFEQTFSKVLKDCEAKADEARRLTSARANAGAVKAHRPQNCQQRAVKANGIQAPAAADDEDGLPDTTESGQESNAEHSDEAQDVVANGKGATKAFDISKMSKTASSRKIGGRGAPKRVSKDDRPKLKVEETTGKTKKNRKWGSLASDGPEQLDFSTPSAVNGGEGITATVLNDVSLMDADEDDYDEDDVDDATAVNGSAKPAAKAAGGGSGLLGSFVNSLAIRVVGKAALSADDLAPALAEMKRKLMERNVAEEIAARICESVAATLEGQRLGSFTGVGAFVRRAFEAALNGILNKRPVDVLLDIKRSKARGKPYVIVFCGVNGVGKSTNLAKIAYWLGQHQVKVMIAACDTFRAGAVEQLKTHCMRLQVPLYERGYERDPAKVASECIRQAEKDGIDVVLVDTAGRMQDNEPLMRALSNLIHVNQPNLVLFVGEALVGNDAVDQLVKFNRALADLAPAGTASKHVIDGIVLTKFDTIDEKVGAALSMVYTSQAPVMFVGCGQTYVDLKKLNVKAVVKSLLK